MFMFGMTGMAHDATVEYNGRRRSEARTAKVSNNRQQNKSAPTQKQEREKNTRDDDDDDDDDPDSKDASSLRRRRLVVDARAAHVKQRLKAPSSHLVSGSFHFDEAHPTVPGDGQARVVAKPRDVHAGVFARLQDRHAFVHVHFSPVHEHRNFLFFFF